MDILKSQSRLIAVALAAVAAMVIIVLLLSGAPASSSPTVTGSVSQVTSIQPDQQSSGIFAITVTGDDGVVYEIDATGQENTTRNCYPVPDDIRVEQDVEFNLPPAAQTDQFVTCTDDNTTGHFFRTL